MPKLRILALLLVSTFAVPLHAQDSGVDARKLIAEQVRSAKDWAVEDIWRHASAIAQSVPAKDLSEAANATLSGGSLDDNSLLLVSSLSLAGSDPDEHAIFQALSPLIDAPKRDVAISVAHIFADVHFKALAAEDRAKLVDHLQASAENAKKDPEVQLAAAHAWYVLGSGEDRRRARAMMSEFLASSDPDLRALGALGLAESNAEITGPLFEELQKLAAIPGERGRLAEAYLETERVHETYERKLKLQSSVKEGGDANGDSDASGKKRTNLGQMSDTDQFRAVMSLILNAHLEGDKVKRSQLLNAALDGMLHAMDEHSTYFDPQEYAKFEQELDAGYGGIGAYVGEDPDDSLFTITHPIYSGPAYRSGLMSDDKIVRVDDWPTLGKPADDVIKRLKGRPGTKVKLYIWRRGMDRSLIDRPSDDMIVEVTRESITIPAVQSQMLPGKVGMVVLHEFSRVATTGLRTAMLELLDQGAVGIILDLRNNSGGLLDEAVGVANLFLPKGKLVVSTESRINPKETFVTQVDPIVPADMPVAVLINRFTASAAEIVSGALQDHQRALLVGKRSFGKGSVQNLIRVPGMEDDEFVDENHNGRHDNWEKLTKDWNGNGEFDYAPRVKLTIARYLLPSGRSIHRELDKEGNILSDGGVKPDLEVDMRAIETWRLEEMYKLTRRSHAARDYVDAHFQKSGELANKQLMTELADDDHRDPTRYPDFDAFVQKLNTPLPTDDVRALVRAEIRRRVQDLRGKEYPQGDFVEDDQLQEAIRVVLRKLGKKPDDFDEYRSSFPAESLSRIALRGQEKLTLRDALEQIANAKKGDGKLSPETLKQLTDLIDARMSY